MKLSPRKTKTFDEICSLQTDNKETSDFWILLSPKTVTICNQRSGQSPENDIIIPRDQFNKLIDWYNLDQKIK